MNDWTSAQVDVATYSLDSATVRGAAEVGSVTTGGSVTAGATDAALGFDFDCPELVAATAEVFTVPAELVATAANAIRAVPAQNTRDFRKRRARWVMKDSFRRQTNPGRNRRLSLRKTPAWVKLGDIRLGGGWASGL